jgi:pentatricopeptide repeat protein
MEEAKVSSNVVHYTALIRACVQKRMFARATLTYERMEEKGIVADTITYNELMRSSVRSAI